MHNDLGISFLYVEQVNAARDEFKKTLELDPLNKKALMSLFQCDVFSKAVSYDENYDPEILEKQLEAMLKENPNDPLVYLYLGDFYYGHNEKEKALKYYQKATDIDSSVANAYHGMGRIYAEEHRNDKSLEMELKAYNLSSWNLAYRVNIAHRYYEMNDYRNATAWYKYTLSLDEYYLLPYYDLSHTYRLNGNLEDALNTQNTLIAYLNDDNITTLRINNNNRPWNFYNINLRNYPMRKYYAYYDIALTYYLLKNETQALEYVNKAKNLHIDENSESDVSKILYWDILKLKKEQPNFTNRTANFRTKFE